MLNIRVGGVPEHFNLPWHLALENGLFESENINVEWKTFKGGTGAMCEALRKDEVDVCIILTEGIVRDIINGNPSKIVSNYIETPLIWGVHTSSQNDLEYYGEIFDKKYAISRKGSGSHLMPMVDAMIKNKTIDESDLVEIKNLDGALESLEKLETDVFYWEKYTAKPYVDSGVLKSLGEFITPWPCFVIAASDKVLDKASSEISDLVSIIQFAASQFVKLPNAIQLLSKRYEQKQEDIENWFHSTEWSSSSDVSEKMLKNVIHFLKKASLIEDSHTFEYKKVVKEIKRDK